LLHGAASFHEFDRYTILTQPPAFVNAQMRKRAKNGMIFSRNCRLREEKYFPIIFMKMP
jgi:hypothetical protein